MPYSVPGLVGEKHYDDDGTYLGYSIPNGFGGAKHYDADGNYAGWSREGLVPGTYVHYDKDNNRVGETREGFVPGTFVHHDRAGNRSDSREGFVPGTYVHHKPETKQTAAPGEGYSSTRKNTGRGVSTSRTSSTVSDQTSSANIYTATSAKKKGGLSFTKVCLIIIALSFLGMIFVGDILNFIRMPSIKKEVFRAAREYGLEDVSWTLTRQQWMEHDRADRIYSAVVYCSNAEIVDEEIARDYISDHADVYQPPVMVLVMNIRDNGKDPNPATAAGNEEKILNYQNGVKKKQQEAAEAEKQDLQRYSDRMPFVGMSEKYINNTKLGRADKVIKCTDFDRLDAWHRFKSYEWGTGKHSYRVDVRYIKHNSSYYNDITEYKDGEGIVISFSYFDETGTLVMED